MSQPISRTSMVLTTLGLACLGVAVLLGLLPYLLDRTDRSSAAAWSSARDRDPQPYASLLMSDVFRGHPETELPDPAVVPDEVAKAYVLIRDAARYARAGRDELAIGRCLDALDVYPDLVHVHEQLGRLYLRTGRYPAAIDSLTTALEGALDPRPLLNDLGVAYLYLGRPAEAREMFRTVLREDPGYSRAVFNAGLATVQLGEMAEAESLFRTYVRHEPGDARALRELARVLRRQDRDDEAYDVLLRAIDADPDWALPRLEAAEVAATLDRRTTALTHLVEAEPLSSPAAVYQVYLQPAFRPYRTSEEGKRFERLLADRARKHLRNAELEQPSLQLNDFLAE